MTDCALSLSSSATTPAWRTSLHRPSDIDEVFSRYLDSVYRFLYSRVGNREDAEDLTSEVFLKATQGLDRDRPEASIAQWLFTVARTVLADHWRRYYRSGAPLPLDDTRAHEIPQGENAAPTERSAQLVERVLSSLPARYRRILELRFLLGYSVAEAAREMDITPENAKVLQHRALAKALQLSDGVL